MRSDHCRRRIAAAAWVLAATIAVPAAAADTTWRASIWGERRTSSEPIEWYAQEVAAKTGGQMKIQIKYGHDKANAAADQIKSGAFDGAYFCTSYFADKMPLATVIELPMFAPENVSVLSRVELALADHPAIQEELRKWNIKMLLPAPLPQHQIMGTRRIARIDDLRGAKVRASVEMGKIFEEFGATTLQINGTRAHAALKRRTLDAYATSYPVTFASDNIHEVSRYVTDKISLGTQFCYFGVSQKAWDALPAKTRQVMQSLRQPAVAKYEEMYAREDAATIAAFKQQGLEFVTFNPADRARLAAKAVKYWQAWIDEREKQGLKGREVFDFTQAKIREFTTKKRKSTT